MQAARNSQKASRKPRLPAAPDCSSSWSSLINCVDLQQLLHLMVATKPTSAHTFSSLTRFCGGISAQCFKDMLYEFFENHSSSCTVNNRCSGELGLRRDALARFNAPSKVAHSWSRSSQSINPSLASSDCMSLSVTLLMVRSVRMKFYELTARVQEG